MEVDTSGRVRLVFEDGDILSRWQRKQGLERYWTLLWSRLRVTIRDFSSHLVDSFYLHDACPMRILLLSAMGGFVLPPFESTSLLKDVDVVGFRQCQEEKR